MALRFILSLYLSIFCLNISLSQDIRDNFNKAETAYEANNITEALLQYDHAFELDSQSFLADDFMNYAILNAEAENWGSAKKFLKKSIGLGYDKSNLEYHRIYDLTPIIMGPTKALFKLIETKDSLISLAKEQTRTHRLSQSLISYGHALSIGKLNYEDGYQYYIQQLLQMDSIKNQKGFRTVMDSLFRYHRSIEYSGLPSFKTLIRDLKSNNSDIELLLDSKFFHDFKLSKRVDLPFSVFVDSLRYAKHIKFENKRFIYDLDYPYGSKRALFKIKGLAGEISLFNCSFSFRGAIVMDTLKGLNLTLCDAKDFRIFPEQGIQKIPNIIGSNIENFALLSQFNPIAISGLFDEPSFEIWSSKISNCTLYFVRDTKPISINVSNSEISSFDYKGKELITLTFSNTKAKKISLKCPSLKKLNLENSKTSMVEFDGLEIQERVNISQSVIDSLWVFHNSRLPELPVSLINWNPTVGENILAVKNGLGNNITGLHLEDLRNKEDFHSLMTLYSQFINLYKAQNDIESYNPAYIAMKDIQSDRLKLLYQENPSFQSYFRFQLSRLLKVYVRHGTDPALALVISTYIILIFALFYFFYPSEWDQKSKKQLLADYRSLIQKNEKGYVFPFFVLSWRIFVSMANAITLSLNSFVTLGFGTIPTTGLARYVVILQGFLGWFLLSIFTVALINQVLG